MYLGQMKAKVKVTLKQFFNNRPVFISKTLEYKEGIYT